MFHPCPSVKSVVTPHPSSHSLSADKKTTARGKPGRLLYAYLNRFSLFATGNHACNSMISENTAIVSISSAYSLKFSISEGSEV